MIALKDVNTAIFEIDYLLDLGLSAEEKGNSEEANNWYSIGIQKAIETQNNEMLHLFKKHKLALYL